MEARSEKFCGRNVETNCLTLRKEPAHTHRNDSTSDLANMKTQTLPYLPQAKQTFFLLSASVSSINPNTFTPSLQLVPAPRARTQRHRQHERP